MPLIDSFRDGIELLLFEYAEDDHEISTLDGLGDDNDGLIDGNINQYMFFPYERKQIHISVTKKIENLKNIFS